MNHKEDLYNYFKNIEGENLSIDEENLDKEIQKNANNKSNLAIKILSVIGSITVCCIFIGLLFISNTIDSELTMSILGIAFIIGAVAINKSLDNIIMDTFSISFYLMGFVMLGIGIANYSEQENYIAVTFILISVITLWLTQNYILSFISALIIHGSLMVILKDQNEFFNIYCCILALGMTYLFLNEAKIMASGKKIAKLYDPIRIAIVFSFLSIFIITSQSWAFYLGLYFGQYWITSLVIILATLYTISYILKILKIDKTKDKIIIYIISFLILASTSLSVAIAGSILIILLSFLVNYKTSFVIGILSFIYFISRFYYDLSLTLLTKSLFLIASGILFLALYYFAHKKLSKDEKI